MYLSFVTPARPSDWGRIGLGLCVCMLEGIPMCANFTLPVTFNLYYILYSYLVYIFLR